MTRAAVVTALYDGYDALKPVLPQTGIDVDWVLVTDDPPPDPMGWRVVHEPRPRVHPNRAAKPPKLRPWEYTDASASVWVDASFRVVSERFVAEVLAAAGPIAQFAHPWRDCLYAEAEASAPMPKYADEPVRAQAEHYRQQGHPEHWGLWAGGVIARHHTGEVRRLGQVWADEIDTWSFQDQVSQPYALRHVGLRPTELWGTHFANPWLHYEGSGRH